MLNQMYLSRAIQISSLGKKSFRGEEIMTIVEYWSHHGIFEFLPVVVEGVMSDGGRVLAGRENVLLKPTRFPVILVFSSLAP